MRLGIMQPYFFPYIGYFQLIGAVDVFVIYDNIKYTKKGWINRNRLLQNGQAVTFTLPLKSDSDFLDIGQRRLAEGFDRDKLLNQLRGAYQRAPQFERTFPLIEGIVRHEDPNLFGYLRNSLEQTCRHLGIATEFRVSSEIPVDHELKSQDRVLALCRALQADTYINAIGGVELYAPETFARAGVALKFIRARPFEYPQWGGAFVPWLSIIDVMMFNSLDSIRARLTDGYELI